MRSRRCVSKLPTCPLLSLLMSSQRSEVASRGQPARGILFRNQVDLLEEDFNGVGDIWGLVVDRTAPVPRSFAFPNMVALELFSNRLVDSRHAAR